MKKIVNSTLAAIALSIVMISTIDARVRGESTGAAELLQASKNVSDAPKAQKPRKAREVVAILSEKGTPAEEQLKAARIKAINQEKEISLQRMMVTDLGYGWFGIGSSKKAKEANDKLKQLKAELKNTEKDIRDLETTTGKKYSGAVRAGLLALATVGITATAYGVDKYVLENQPGMTYLSEKATDIQTRGSKYWEDTHIPVIGKRDREARAAANKAAIDADKAQAAANKAKMEADRAENAANNVK